MLSLLIADDEKIIRESLANCLDWQKIGIRVVGCCANGLEALDCIIDESPDIVITDIKMPGLGGLELIEKMQNIDKEIEFIILSGYREFDFAQKALELGVRRYLLKPVSEKQVLDAVLDAKKCREQRFVVKEALAQHIQLQNQLIQDTSLHVKNSLVFEESSSPNSINCFTVCLPVKAVDEARHLVRTMHAKLAPARLISITNYFYCQNAVLSILRGDGSRAVQDFQELLAVSPFSEKAMIQEPAPLSVCVQQLHHQLTCTDRIYTLDQNGILYELLHSGVSQKTVQQLYLMAKDDELDELEAHIRSDLLAINSIYTLRAASVHLIISMLAYEQTLNLTADSLKEVLAEIYGEENREALVNRVIQIVLSLLQKEQQSNSLVQEVKNYVRSNLSDSTLSLKRIATQYVHANADYLSRLFAQETGEKFSHYLNRKRVDKAKQLLQEDSSRVYQVAEQIGLGHNPRYFSQVFKKYVGVTPTAFIEKDEK